MAVHEHLGRPAVRLDTLPAIAVAAATLLAGIAGFYLTDASAAREAASAAGTDLVRLLRFMTAMKAGLAAGAIAAVLWRLQGAAPGALIVAYAAACAAMAVGVGLMWRIAEVGMGATALHAGLFAAVVLLFCDPAVGQRLKTEIALQRARLR
jgi:hypothetical protein